MTISLGTPFAIDTGVLIAGAGGIKTAQLSSTKAIVIYIDDDNSGRPTAITVESDETTGTAFEIAAQSSSTLPNIVALSSTKALAYWRSSGGNNNFRVLNISGTTITAPGAILTASFSTSASAENAFVNLTSANSLFIYTFSTGTHAVVMSVSVNTVTEESGGAVSGWASGVWASISATALSSTKILCCYGSGLSNEGTATILNVSGTTVSDGAVDTVFEAGDTDSVSVDAYSSSAAIVTYGDNDDSGRGKAQIITVSGNTPSANTPLTYQTTAVIETAVAAFDSSAAVVISDGPDTITELSISGTTVTKGDESAIALTDDVSIIAYDSTTVLTAYDSGVGLAIVTGIIVTFTPPSDVLTLSVIPKPASIDASGEFIYIALLNNGTPILSKVSTALDGDGSTVFDPGAGDTIGVECGRFNADIVWIAGQFDGTNVVEKSEDGGSSFAVKDGALFGGVRAFVVGPDSDDKVLLFDEDNGDILETTDDGQTWTTINASVTPEIYALARLGKNTQEIVAGNQGGANNSINYSVNSGDDLEDYQTGVYPNANATGVIING